MTVPFILDTDTAQDDCVALIAEPARPGSGPAGHHHGGRQRRLRPAGAQCADEPQRGRPPGIGAHPPGLPAPLVLPWVSAENVHGDGSGGLDMDFAGTVTEDEHGVDALIRLTAESPGEISVVATGPLTNIAMAAVKDPDFVRNVKSLVIMGGSNNGRGNISAAGEFNFYVDPHAAHVVFEAGFRDVTVVPWAPLTLKDAVFSREQLAGIEAIGMPLSKFFLTACGPTLAFDESVGIRARRTPTRCR